MVFIQKLPGEKIQMQTKCIPYHYATQVRMPVQCPVPGVRTGIHCFLQCFVSDCYAANCPISTPILPFDCKRAGLSGSYSFGWTKWELLIKL